MSGKRDTAKRAQPETTPAGGARQLEHTVASPAGHEVPPIVHEVLSSAGQPLDTATRAFMEPRFGHDFGGVRVHTGPKAAVSASAVNALAYTVGRDVVFGTGQYRPQSAEGKGLMAHELAHVVQQSRSSYIPGHSLVISAPGSHYERQADTAVRSMSAGGAAAFSTAAPPQVMRATRTFALTFDDGPHAAELGKGKNRTEKVLDILNAQGVKAGFFIQTDVSFRGADKNGQALVARMAKEGHTVGIHTGGKQDHEVHTQAEKAGRLESELQAAETYIQTQTGAQPKFVRPPKGIFDAGVEARYKKMGLTNLLWDIDGDKGMNLKLAELKARLKAGITDIASRGWKGTTPVAPKIVVLYHDIQANTANNIGTLVEELKSLTTSISGGKDTAEFDAP